MAELDLENLKAFDDLLKERDPSTPPSVKEILEMIESANLDEETKNGLRSMVTGNVPKVFGGYGSGTMLAVLFVLLMFSVILFFGYKLYRSIKDKEKKMEDKKKAKQMKKKK